MRELFKISAILSAIEVLVTLAIPYMDAQGFAVPRLMIEMAALIFIATPLIYLVVYKPKTRRMFS